MIRAPEKFREAGIDVLTRVEATGIDPANREVWVAGLDDGSEKSLSYDLLLIATGAHPICPDVPGSGAEGIHGICSLQAAVNLRRYLDEKRPRSGVIVGGGYIGLEMAEALVRQGLKVSLVERAQEVMGTMDPDMAALISRGLEGLGVTVYREEAVTAFETDAGGVLSAVVTDKRTIPADVAVLGLGVAPNAKLAEDAGLEVGVKKAIRVDDRMRTSVAGIWAAGDCVDAWHLVSRSHVHIPLGTVANRQGRVAGVVIAGGDASFPGVVGTAITKVCELEIARTGLTEREAHDFGLISGAATITSPTHATYYPGAAKMTVKLVAEKGTGRLLGGQIVGGNGAGKRIDVLAAALHAGFDLQQIVDLDLAYAPPFSLPWDPVQIAAREALKEV